jgi:hypothetical protein
LADPQTVVIDVRNNYGTQIDMIHPPPGDHGAPLLNQKLCNSCESPKWLVSEETQKQFKL